MEHERNLLLDKLAALQRELDAALADADRQKHELLLRIEQLQNIIAGMQGELAKLKQRLDDIESVHWMNTFI